MGSLPLDSELAEAAAATYIKDARAEFEDIRSAIRVFLIERPECNILAIEGTHDPIGWAVDLCGMSVRDQQGMQGNLGYVHAGFYAAAVAAHARCVMIAQRGPYAICGHSLGAALALLLGGLLINDGLAPAKIAAFAPPRVGGEQFVKIITAVPCTAYRYGADPVTQVPVTVEPLLPYRQLPLIRLVAPPVRPLDFAAIVACHRIENYIAGIKLLETAVPV